MSLSRADVELLDRNLQDLTETGLKRRGLNIAQQRADQEHEAEVARELTNRRMLEAEERRAKSDEARESREAEGTSTVYLQGPKGGTFEYRGPKSGLKAWLDQGSKVVDKPDTNPKMGRYEWTDPHGGKAVFDLNSPDDLANVQKLATASGYQNKPGMQTRELANDAKAKEFEDKAAELESRGSTAQPGSEAGTILQQAADYRRRAKYIREGRGATTWETTSTTVDPNTQQPKTTTTIRRPAGSVAPALSTPPPTGASAAAAPAAPTAGQKVKMKHPNGQIGLVPASQVDAAKAQGYQLVP